MNLVKLAMTRPVTITVFISAVVLFSIFAIFSMKVDIFPFINMPRITVVQPYGGMEPTQMEGFLVTEYEQHFFYISDVDHVSSRAIQGVAIMDVYFRPEANMSDAMAQVVAQVERTRAYLPPGTVSPFILRYDVGSVPVGFLTFSSKNRSLASIQDLVYSRIRPVVSTTPGVSTPPPFGGNQRTIVISVDIDRLNEYRLSIEDIVKVIHSGNTIMPSGVVRIKNLQRIASSNSIVSNIQELGNLPLETKSGPTVYLRDIATVSDSTDIQTGFALVDKKRTVYMAISKQSTASTIAVVNGVKEKIELMKTLLPNDIQVKFVFDQSVYVTEALHGLIFEGVLGALLTGGVVLLFLGDIRSSLIVVLSIPFALLAALVGLMTSGQTINIMTLGGLSLSIGILVDQATVSIENIHSKLQKGNDFIRSIYDGSVEVLVPNLLALLAVLSVFTPCFFMSGATQSLFVPLSLAVGFSLISSYFLSATFVPVAAGWFLKRPVMAETPHNANGMTENKHKDFMETIRPKYDGILERMFTFRLAIFAVYAVLIVVSAFAYFALGSEIFPAGNPKSFQLRVKAPVGTRFEETEKLAKEILFLVDEQVGKKKIEVSVAYAGSQPPSYGISSLYIWTSGPHEAVLDVAFREGAGVNLQQFQERLRKIIQKKFPDVLISFEAGDIVNKVMNFGSMTPIQVDIDGPNYLEVKRYAHQLQERMTRSNQLRDVGIVQPLEYPNIAIDIDRQKAGQHGVTVSEVGKALVAATYSSRFISPIHWKDPKGSLSYQVQVQVPQHEMSSLEDIGKIPVKTGTESGPFVRDLANLSYGFAPGEIDHYNMRRVVSVSANISGSDLGRATEATNSAIASLGTLPKGVHVTIRGQVPTMKSTFAALIGGVCIAIVSIFLMLTAYFQSLRIALSVLSVIPAIISGAILILWVSGTTINVQSFMGTIMSTGVGVANAILVAVFAEENRRKGMSARVAAMTAASARLRPVMMTSISMIAGMIPMALALSEGGDRTAPLGRAVIGGLIMSTTTVLFVLPIVYAMMMRRAGRKSASLLPPAFQQVETSTVETSTFKEGTESYV